MLDATAIVEVNRAETLVEPVNVHVDVSNIADVFVVESVANIPALDSFFISESTPVVH